MHDVHICKGKSWAVLNIAMRPFQLVVLFCFLYAENLCVQVLMLKREN